MIRTTSTSSSIVSLSLQDQQQQQPQKPKRRKFFRTANTTNNKNSSSNSSSSNNNRLLIVLLICVSTITTTVLRGGGNASPIITNHQYQQNHHHHRLQYIISITEYIVRPIVVVATHYYSTKRRPRRHPTEERRVPFWNRRQQQHRKSNTYTTSNSSSSNNHYRTIQIHHTPQLHYQYLRNETSSTNVDYCTVTKSGVSSSPTIDVVDDHHITLQPSPLRIIPVVMDEHNSYYNSNYPTTLTFTTTASSVMEAFILRHQIKKRQHQQQHKQQEQQEQFIHRGGHIDHDDETITSVENNDNDSNEQEAADSVVLTDDTDINDEVTKTDSTSTASSTTKRLDEEYKPLTKNKSSSSPYHFSFFQMGDGSDEDIDGIPTRYLIMQNNHRPHAIQAVQSTLQWRKQHNVDTILQRPHIQYDIAKRIFPHYFVELRDIYNHIIFIQRPALLNLQLAEKNNLSPQQLLDHYIYVNEYLWQILEGDDALATMTSIIDLQGLNLKYLRQGEIVNFMKEFVKTMDNHYPQRAYKTFIVNAPKWFNILYKIVSPLLRESTKAKIEIYTRSKRQDKALHTLMGSTDKAEKVLPASFFTKKKDHDKNKKKHDNARRMTKKNKDDIIDEAKVDEDSTDNTNNDDSSDDEIPQEEENPQTMSSKFETDLREFTLARIQEAGLQMLEVVPL